MFVKIKTGLKNYDTDKKEEYRNTHFNIEINNLTSIFFKLQENIIGKGVTMINCFSLILTHHFSKWI